jgi:threonylcarbamoyladenosine tRNA methylthiotransferase MtaB
MPQVEKATIKRRAAELRAKVSERRTKWLEGLVGTPQTVLAEADGTGHAENFARAVLPTGTPRGALVTVTPSKLTEGLLR